MSDLVSIEELEQRISNLLDRVNFLSVELSKRDRHIKQLETVNMENLKRLKWLDAALSKVTR